jgi:hypothetical protein
VPYAGAVVSLVLAGVSPRWTVRDKVVAALLTLSPAVLAVTAMILPIRPWSLPGGQEAFLLLLVTGPLAAGYLAVVLSRRAAFSGRRPTGAQGPLCGSRGSGGRVRTGEIIRSIPVVSDTQRP